MRTLHVGAFAAKVSAALSVLLLGSCILVFDYGDYTDPAAQTGSSSGGGAGQGGGGEEPCEANTTIACYSGPEGTDANAPCTGGMKTCDSDGRGYGPCVGEVIPGPEICLNQVDEDCNAERCAEPLWARRFGGAEDQGVSGAAFDIDNLYVAGSFTGTIKIGEDSGMSATRDAANGSSWYAIKLGGNAEPGWVSASSDPTPSHALAVSAGQNVYVSGYQGVSGTGTGEDGFFVNLAPDTGQPQSPTVISGPGNDRVIGVVNDSAVVHAAVSFHDTVSLPPSMSLASKGGSDIAVVSYIGPNVVQWTRSFGGTGDDTPVAITSSSSGSNLAITGAYRHVLYEGANQVAPDAGAKSDIFVASLFMGGAVAWTRGFVDSDDALDSQGQAVAIDSLGDVVVTGRMAGSVDCTGDKAVVANSGGGYDVFVAKVQSGSGNLAWCKAFGGADDQEGTGVFVDSEFFIYLTGTFAGSIDFDPTSTTDNLTSTGGQNIFVAKLNPDGAPVWTARFGNGEPLGFKTVRLGGTQNGQFVLATAWTTGLDFGSPEGLLKPEGSGLDILLAKLSK